MTRLAFQIPNFDLPDVPVTELFERVAGMACQAEQSGFDTVMVMDHFYQLPMLGKPDDRMLEAYTLLGALAARTRTARLGTLVSGNTYRNPALLAKIVTTLDVVSGGRALLGIGTGWFEQEHDGYGFRFGSLAGRFEKLEEALQIIVPMLKDERPSFEGRHYQAREAINFPPPIQRGGPALMIGGAGEKKTLRLVARFADESNLPCAADEIPRKLEALDRHCSELGRDRSEIKVSWLGSVLMAPTREQAERERNAYLGRRGMDYESLPPAIREGIDRALVIGDPDGVGEFVSEKLVGAGLDGLTLNMPANGHDLEAIAMVGETLGKLFP